MRGKIEIILHEIHRPLLYLLGLAGTCVGVSLCLKSTMGIDAWNASIAGLAILTPLSLGQWTMIVHFSFWLLSTWIDKQIRAQSIFPVLYKGIVLDAVNPIIDEWVAAEGYFSLLIVFIIGYLILSLSTGLYLAADYPRMPVDGLMFSLGKLLKGNIKKARLMIELTGFTVMIIVHGTFGIGTIIITLTCGYMFSSCKNIFEKMLNRRKAKEKH
ncbi:MAG TPA: hypothetical protein IAB31_10565 [Candidatus Choladousia intestinavium]|uniref:YitT family protein n=1 Tax=Candidatus Choladousia intestinavium TaxID=2840727 RepID=A0A9D1AFD6_9FIRM|nr:hypothetical protein [Candidatus Choladousia intestinavium]